MVVTKKTIDPYIASRNYGESTSEQIVFEGTKKECEKFLLDEFNDRFQNEIQCDSVGQAIRWSNKRGCLDGLYRNNYHGKNLFMHWDSRYWEIKHKNEVEK